VGKLCRFPLTISLYNERESSMSIEVSEKPVTETWADEEVVARVLNGETAAFEIIMRRHNQRLYRVSRSILRDDAEAEDVMQDAYVRADQPLAQFAGRAKFSTWLTRIAVREALARAQRRSRFEALESFAEHNEDHMILASHAANPEQEAASDSFDVGRCGPCTAGKLSHSLDDARYRGIEYRRNCGCPRFDRRKR
jgi:Sigma-70 region 2